jgi:hypothetical protein
MAHRLDHRAARHRGAVASSMAPSSMDVALHTDTSRTPQDGYNYSNAPDHDGHSESAVGSTSDPRRIVQVGHHAVRADCPAAPAAPASPSVTDLADLPDQSRHDAGLNGLLHRPDPHRPSAERVGPALPRAPANHPRNIPPPYGRRNRLSRPFRTTPRRGGSCGSRRHLRGSVPAPCRRHGHFGGHHQSLKPLANPICGDTDRIHSARVSGPRDRPRRTTSATPPDRVRHLLSPGANTPRLRAPMTGNTLTWCIRISATPSLETATIPPKPNPDARCAV